MDGDRVLEFLEELLLEVFVPVLFEVSVSAVETGGPLLLVEVDLVGLVNEVAGQQHDCAQLDELPNDTCRLTGFTH